MSQFVESCPIAATLTLQHIKGIGPARLQQLLEYFGTPQLILSASREALAELGNGKLLMALADDLAAIQAQGQRHRLVVAAAREINYCAENNIQLVIASDVDFSDCLKQISASPALLYVKGNLEILNKPQLSMVGARNASAEGCNNARTWAQTLGRAGLVITSGLAEGIDAAAHQGALDVGAKTIAVVAHGLDSLYPRRHQYLSDEILGSGGAIVSEFAIGMKPQREYFPRRNRIISGLSLGVCVVEAAIKSGSLITARFAIEQNRHVYALPSHINNVMAEGCHYLIQQGAELVTKPEEILQQLILESGFTPSENAGQISASKSIVTECSSLNLGKPCDEIEQTYKEQGKLLKCLSFTPSHFDQLVKSSGLATEQLSVALMQLEMQGVIVSESGFYRRI